MLVISAQERSLSQISIILLTKKLANCLQILPTCPAICYNI
ncbi:hypothetical protein B6N60_05106 [Richelia sinica FACHB-800]|uniref:Uncharacterized protein n=1 Tax=Richelia sinica FACHB-800 TaxID=1357546 RepID=A0A975TDB2_9NOST|nr:hypothetical protein B6N60_05106 [Richelia sinica FACHB-800]